MNFTLPYPPSANRYVRHTANGSYRTAEANRYRRQAQLVVIAAGMLKCHLSPIEVHGILHPKMTKTGRASETRIDLDNCLKVALDALQGVAYDDDRQIRRITLEVGHPLAGGGLSLEVFSL